MLSTQDDLSELYSASAFGVHPIAPSPVNATFLAPYLYNVYYHIIGKNAHKIYKYSGSYFVAQNIRSNRKDV